MKALIISDVHSNICALEAIWARERDSDRVYYAGDLVDYGPYPKEVITWARQYNVTCVQGNHDALVAACYRSGQRLDSVPLAERAWVHHNASLLDEEDIIFLEQLPQACTFSMDGTIYGMTHIYQDYEEMQTTDQFEQFCNKTFAKMEKCSQITRLIFGHTHRQCVRELSQTQLWLNPGSVSFCHTNNNSKQTAHYITITDGHITTHQLDYNIEPLQRYVRQVSLKESEIRLAERFFCCPQYATPLQ